MTRDVFSVLERYMPSQTKKVTVSKGEYPEGRIEENDQGRCLVVEYSYPLTYLYGGTAFGKVLALNKDILDMLIKEYKKYDDIYDLMFFDTETTGLSSGAGTVIFLAGAGYFENDRFILKQFFLRDYDDEPAMLEFVSSLMEKRPVLVTFNGKAFDWNLMLGRYTTNRLKPKRRSPVHLDLLHPSRTLWKRRLSSCSLVSLEENILSEYRSDDIPGALIPGVYFDYLDTGIFDERMKRVFVHNRLDVLSMVSLLGKICEILTDPLRVCENAIELFGTGVLFEKAGWCDSMISCFERCIESRNIYIKQAALEKLSGFYKRKQEYDKIVSCWLEQAKDTYASSHRIYSMIELAKYFEHKQKDTDFAIKITNEAIKLARSGVAADTELLFDLNKRLDRLIRKHSVRET